MQGEVFYRNGWPATRVWNDGNYGAHEDINWLRKRSLYMRKVDYFNNSKNFSKIKDFKALLIISLSDKKQLAAVKMDLRNRTEARFDKKNRGTKVL